MNSNLNIWIRSKYGNEFETQFHNQTKEKGENNSATNGKKKKKLFGMKKTTEISAATVLRTATNTQNKIKFYWNRHRKSDSCNFWLNDDFGA